MSSNNKTNDYGSLVTAVTHTIQDTLKSVKTKHGKVISKLVDMFDSEEVQSQIKEAVREHMPKQKRPRQKSSKLKDPSKPKRPKTGYMLFQAAHRSEVVDDLRISKRKWGRLPENREKGDKSLEQMYQSDYSLDKQADEHSRKEYKPKVTVVGIKIGQMWRSLDESEKEEWNKKARPGQIAYKKAMEDYERPSDEELAQLPENQRKRRGSGKATGKGRRKKRPGEPKGPLNAYLYFCRDQREKAKEEDPENKISVNELGELWKEYKNQDTKWHKMAEQDRERYKREMAEYKAKHGDDDDDSNDETETATAPAPKARTKGKTKHNADAATTCESDDETTAAPATKTRTKGKTKHNASKSDDETTVAPTKTRAKGKTKHNAESDDEPLSRPKTRSMTKALVPGQNAAAEAARNALFGDSDSDSDSGNEV